MRSINSAFRLAPPLLAAGCAALFGACAPGPVQTTYGVPQVNNIYAVDVDNGLPNVLIYSSVDPRVSPTPPPAYSAFQIEFNQPMNGGTLAAQADRSVAALGKAIYCDPSGAAITLTDTTGATVFPSSVCYDPTSDIGGNPHVTIIPGAGGATTPSPFTCQTFSATGQGADLSGNGSIPAGTYAFKFASTIASASGQALQFPSTGGWSAGKYTFTTAGLAIMAAGFQDPVTGYYSWFAKPFPGFMKDLNEAGKSGLNKGVASCSTDVDCQLTQSAAPGAPTGQFGQVCAAGVCSYRQQVAMYGGAQTPTPFLIITSELLNTSASGEPVTSPGGAPTVTVARADGTGAFPATISTLEPRVITVTPNGSWESGTAYTVTVAANLTAADKTTTLGTPQTFTFTAGTTALGPLKPPSPDEDSTGKSIATGVTVSYPVPLDPLKTSGVQLLLGTTPVTLALGVPLDSTGQVVSITPAAPLNAGTLYTVSIKGLFAAPAPAAPTALAGKPVTDYTYNFTTRNFNAVSVTLPTGPTTPPKSLDRAFNVSPVALQTGVTINYTEAAQTIDTTVVKVFENATTGQTSVPVSVTIPTASNAASDTITTAQPVKFGQKYVIQSLTTMKSARGATLTAEGCQPGTGADCSDLKAFTTALFGGTLKVTDKSVGVYTFTFNNPVTPATLTPNLTNGSFKLFKQDAVTNARTPVTVNCTATSTTVVTCTAAAPLYTAGPPSSGGNTVYIANVGILSGVAAAATTAGGFAVDPSTPLFTGGASSTFATPCP
jgi:Bacterial Ig-like domain